MHHYHKLLRKRGQGESFCGYWSWQYVIKTFWKYAHKINISWVIHLEDMLQTSWKLRKKIILSTAIHYEDVLQMSWKRIEDVFARHLEYVLKTLWRRFEGVWPRRIYFSWTRSLEDIFKKSSEDVWPRWIYLSWSWHLEDPLWGQRPKTSSARLLRQVFAGMLLICTSS